MHSKSSHSHSRQRAGCIHFVFGPKSVFTFPGCRGDRRSCKTSEKDRRGAAFCSTAIGARPTVRSLKRIGCKPGRPATVSRHLTLMKMAWPLVYLILAVCLFSGCTSYHWLLRPGASGIVVDSQTSIPIAGAQIKLSKDPALYGVWYAGDGLGLRAVTTTSATNGTFNISPLRALGHIDTVTPNVGRFYVLTITRDGYAPYTNKLRYSSGDYSARCYKDDPLVSPATNFEKIQLEKLLK